MPNLDYSFSKNYQDESTIKRMFENSFNEDSSDILISSINGGMKNALYLIQKSGLPQEIRDGLHLIMKTLCLNLKEIQCGGKLKCLS